MGDEIKKLGLSDVRVENGRVLCHGEARDIAAPMPGAVVKILVSEGQQVAKDQPVAVLEVMKMEQNIPSAFDGVVKKISVRAGEQVQTGQTLMTLA